MKSKKLLSILAAGALMLGFAGTSMAALTSWTLYSAVYDKNGTYEADRALATFGTAGSGANVIINSDGTIKTGWTSGAGVAFQWQTGTTDSDTHYFTTKDTHGAWTVQSTGLTAAFFGTSDINGNNGDGSASLYATGGTTGWKWASKAQFYTIAQGNISLGSTGDTQPTYYNGYKTTYAGVDYWGMLKGASGSTGGKLAGTVSTVVEASLSSLANTTQDPSTVSVTQNLYVLTYGAGNNTAAKLVGTIQTFADGHIKINSAVPVPPSLMLLAPGLLGLIGLRRRSSADKA